MNRKTTHERFSTDTHADLYIVTWYQVRDFSSISYDLVNFLVDTFKGGSKQFSALSKT